MISIENLNQDHQRVGAQQTASLDAFSNAIVNATGTLTQLSVNAGTLNWAAADKLSLDTSGSITLSNGLALDSKLSVAGVEIGKVTYSETHAFAFAFNQSATAGLVQQVIHALRYTNERSDDSYLDQKSFEILLFGDTSQNEIAVANTVVTVAPQSANVLTPGTDAYVGTNGDDIFVSDDVSLNLADSLDGGGGVDTLRLFGRPDFDLASLSVLSHIEKIQGSSQGLQGQRIIISDANLADVETIAGGASESDTLELRGTTFDVTAKSISGFESIVLASDQAEIQVASKELALIVRGIDAQNDHLTWTGGTFSFSERQQLHKQGIDKITDASGTYTDLAPVITGLDGDQATVTLASWKVFLDAKNDVAITDDDNNRISTLSVKVVNGNPFVDLLGLEVLPGNVELVGGFSLGARVFVNGFQVGVISQLSQTEIIFDFRDYFTSGQSVSKLIQALTYTSKDATPVAGAEKTIEFTVADEGGRYSKATVHVELANERPTDITPSQLSVSENAASGSLVGQLSAVDPNKGDGATYKLIDDAGGRFKLSGGQLLVADGTKLDFEQAASHAVKVLVTDTHGLTLEKTLQIAVKDVSVETVIGTAASDTIKGGNGDDRLSGEGGDDRIYGGGGKDVLTGGAGKDVFVFDTTLNKKTNLDKIVDFSVKDDTLWLDNAVFKKLGKGSEAKPGKLNKAFFTIGDHAKDKNDYLIYDNKKGVLYYDADGAGKGKAVEITTLKKGLKMTAADFLII
ncbi:hypothetical protein [Microvirga puerhi]|uniref:hypothetical protein n=1 Tax=Microvirga puerhi TaxID=2876078 RepID=UPI00272E2C02|nr:hypothetical protein [Microvirga puerhi]